MKSYTESYQEALQRSFKTWPLYAWQLGFEFLRVITILPCLAVAAWPLIQSRAEFAGADFSKLTDTLLALMWTSGWWMVAVGMFALYIVWWLILEAIINGAVFGRLWAYEEKKEPFEFGKYIREGFRFFLPLIGLHLLTSLLVIVACALAGLFAAGVSILLAGAGLPKWAGILITVLPIGLVLAVALVFAAAWWLVARGYVTTGHGVVESLKLSFGKCHDKGGRVFWGILVLLIIVFAVLFGVGFVFSILEHIPFLGFLFMVANYAISILSAAFLAVYIPSVVVTFLDEKA